MNSNEQMNNIDTNKITPKLVKKLGEDRKTRNGYGEPYFLEKVYFKREVEKGEYSTYYKGWFCVKCEEPLNIFINRDKNYSHNQPYKVHRAYIKSKVINENNHWHPDNRITAHYFNALCCKCYEKEPVPEDDPRKSSEDFKPFCDCVIYLKEQVKEAEQERNEANEKVKGIQSIIDFLNPPKEVAQLFNQNQYSRDYLKKLISESEEDIKKARSNLVDRQDTLFYRQNQLHQLQSRYKSKIEVHLENLKDNVKPSNEALYFSTQPQKNEWKMFFPNKDKND